MLTVAAAAAPRVHLDRGRVLFYLDRARLSQRVLAAAVGVPEHLVSRWLRQGRAVDAEVARRLAFHLRVELHQVLVEPVAQAG
jgi:plasmid maintenance system antidote protein VapI